MSAASAFNKQTVLTYIDRFLEEAGVDCATVDVAQIDQAFQTARKMEDEIFAYSDQLSAFKVAAVWAIAFVRHAPIRSPLPRSAVGALADLPNHQNIVVALAIAFDLLAGATVGDFTIVNAPRLEPSHFVLDLANSLAVESESDSQQAITLALVLESLAYRANETTFDDSKR